MVNLLTSLIINLDFIPIVFFVFLYSFLEILFRKLMDDFRSIQIQQQHHHPQQEEQEEDLVRDRIIFPVNLNIIHRFEENHDDVSDDYDDDGDDYDDDNDDELIPVPIEDFDDDDDFEDDDFDFDDDYDDDDDDFDDDFDEEEEEDDMTSPSRVSNSVTANECGDRTIVKEETSSNGTNGNGDQIDGLICPICFEPWTSNGTHQICCLPCGHLYGLACIKKWLYQRRSSRKCPQCNSLCTFKDVRVLYVNRLCVADEELQKRVRLLEVKCASLEQKVVPLTPDELIDQICSNPTLVQRLATMLTELHQPQVSP